uniref:Uncharacterized protein n=1 Tax=Rhizophora mucronata TaxID=61149 RepID=A0A2P2K735_RHIMU
MAQVRQLFPEIIRRNELLPAGIPSISTHSGYHMPMRQKLAPFTYYSSKLVVPLLQFISIWVHITRSILIQGLQRSSTPVARCHSLIHLQTLIFIFSLFLLNLFHHQFSSLKSFLALKKLHSWSPDSRSGSIGFRCGHQELGIGNWAFVFCF